MKKKMKLKNDFGVLREYIVFMFDLLDIKLSFLIILNIFTFTTACLGGVGIAVITRKIIDEVFLQLNIGYLEIAIPVFTGYYIVASLFDIITVFFTVKWKIDIDCKMKNIFYKRVIKIRYDCLNGITATDLYYRMVVDGNILTQYLFKLCINIPTNIALCCIFFAIMIVWSFELTIYTLLLVILQMSCQHFIKYLTYKINIRQKEAEQSLLEFLMEKLQLIDVQKTLNLDVWWGKQVCNHLKSTGDITKKNTFEMDCLSRIIAFIQQIWTIGFLILGAILVYRQKCSVGVFLGFQTLINCLLTPLQTVLLNIMAFQEAKVAYKRYAEYFNLPVIEPMLGIEMNFKKKLSIEYLRFAYGGSKKLVFDKLNLDFYTDSMVAILGDNGSGKTTLMKLCARLLTPDQGRILIDDVLIENISYDSYRDSFSFMLQTPLLLNGSFRDNLVLGDDVQKDELDNIVKICDLSEVVERLPNGINTQMGKNDISLSNGEIQRVCLARILLKKPKLIWLDEPTASLDKKSEKIILNALVTYKRNNHALVIINTHSKTVTDYADYIYNL